MWVQATFSRDDFVKFADRLFPVHLALQGDAKDGRHVYIGNLQKVEIVPTSGIRVEARARVLWPVLGITVPVDVPTIQVLLIPHVVRVDDQDVFAFRPQVEGLDISYVPGIVERELIKVINVELAKEPNAIRWKFSHTLDFDFNLPSEMDPARKIHLQAKWGDVRVTAEGITLAASFDADVSKPGDVKATAALAEVAASG